METQRPRSIMEAEAAARHATSRGDAPDTACPLVQGERNRYAGIAHTLALRIGQLRRRMDASARNGFVSPVELSALEELQRRHRWFARRGEGAA